MPFTRIRIYHLLSLLFLYYVDLDSWIHHEEWILEFTNESKPKQSNLSQSSELGRERVSGCYSAMFSAVVSCPWFASLSSYPEIRLISAIWMLDEFKRAKLAKQPVKWPCSREKWDAERQGKLMAGIGVRSLNSPSEHFLFSFVTGG